MSSKKLISLRVDQKILSWFKSKQPKGYQTLIHSILEEYVEQQILQSNRVAGRAQEVFHQYYARCFWHYDRTLEITPDNIHLVINGLRKYGGREGLVIAEDLSLPEGLCNYMKE